MESVIAIVGDADLEAALKEAGLPVTACPAATPRERLRWVMELTPSRCLMLVIRDNEGATTAALSTALDPAIPAMVWAPSPTDAPRLLTILQDCPVSLNLAPTAQALARLLNAWLQPGRQADVRDIPMANIQNLSPAPALETVSGSGEEDDRLFQQLEAMMEAQVKEAARPVGPVAIQTPALDFSLPLRKLMSAGDQLAVTMKHPEVTGLHYLARLEEPYQSALAKAGLEPARLEAWIAAEFDPISDQEPVISDGVFEAISRAKQWARERNASCIRVSDFLGAVFSAPDELLEKALEHLGASRETILQALTAYDAQPEACDTGFFAPSSLDQEGFYEFNANELRSVEERLKDLPAFQKAAARGAEGKKPPVLREASGGVPTPEAAQRRTAAPAPETPVILRVESDFPEMDAVELIADQLLEGQVVAFPNDVMFALAADATNPGAVERLREMVGNDPDRRLSLLIHSVSQLKHLVRADLEALEPMLDELWPGPLTLVFRAAPGLGRHVTSQGTIAIRLPADNLSLAVLSMLGRPLAVTSWDKSGGVAALTGELEGLLGLAVASPEQPAEVITTVADLTKNPWEILREGAVAESRLRAYSSK